MAKGMGSGNAVAWVEAKSEYVHGIIDQDGNHYFPTHKEIAAKYGATYRTVTSRSQKEEWLTERQLYIENLEKRKREKRIEALAGEASDFDARILKSAKAGLAHIEEHFRIAKRVFKDEGKPLELAKLDRLARSLDKYQKIGRLALGEATHNVHSNTETWLQLLEVLDDE